MSELYSHPQLRELAHDQLVERLQQIRDRRLVMALQYEATRRTKVQRLNASLQEKWEKQNERNRLALLKIDELIDKFEAALSKQQQISHELSLTEQEFTI